MVLFVPIINYWDKKVNGSEAMIGEIIVHTGVIGIKEKIQL